MVVLKGRGFVLRPIRITDAQGYLECHQDADAKANFSSVPDSVSAARKEIKEGRRHNKKFAILVDGDFAGFINLELNDHPRYKHSAIVGYGIHEHFRGRGLATKVLKKITEYGFRDLKLKRISGVCRSFNTASARVLEKAGYTHEGTLHKNKFLHGKYLDDMVWARWK